MLAGQDEDLLIIVSVLSTAWLVLFVITIVLWSQVCGLKKKVQELQATSRIRVQKLKMDDDKNHSFHNPALSSEEELSRRGFSIYAPNDDVENGRPNERQTGGQFLDELHKELDSRQQKTASPSFLLQSIQESKKKRGLNNYDNNGRQSETNPNFMY